MLLRNAAHSGRRVIPPLLLQQKSLIKKIERPFLPIVVDETPVLRQRFDAGLRTPTFDRVAISVIPESDGFADRLVRQLQALTRCICEMSCPVQVGVSERRRRQTACKAGHGGMQRVIGSLRKRRHSGSVTDLRSKDLD